jgi:shikimate dehydrogenase
VSVWNRTPGRAEAIVRELGAADSLAVVEAAEARAGSFDLIVNCTAVGMKDEDPFEDLPLEPDRLTSGVSVVDLVYAGSESRLVTAARERGATGIDGLEVLVRQGGESLRIWTGMDPPLDVMREAARGGEADGWSGA